jgi:excisionase family DNA binding protein
MTPLISIKAAAALLGISRSKLYQLCSTDQIPYVQIGARLLFRETDLEKWVADRVVVVK